MQTKALLAAAVLAALAMPTLHAAGDSRGTSASLSAATSDGGAEAMFKSLDKDKDGYISKEEAKGTPHDKDFATLDKDQDGKLSREEHAAAPEHQKSASGSGGSAGTTTGSTRKY